MFKKNLQSQQNPKNLLNKMEKITSLFLALKDMLKIWNIRDKKEKLLFKENKWRNLRNKS